MRSYHREIRTLKATYMPNLIGNIQYSKGPFHMVQTKPTSTTTPNVVQDPIKMYPVANNIQSNQWYDDPMFKKLAVIGTVIYFVSMVRKN